MIIILSLRLSQAHLISKIFIILSITITILLFEASLHLRETLK